MTTLKSTIQTAHKDYPCCACGIWHGSGLESFDVSADDWLIVQDAKADGGMIRKGQKYHKVVYVDDGRIVTYRARIDMDSLVSRLNLWPE